MRHFIRNLIVYITLLNMSVAVVYGCVCVSKKIGGDGSQTITTCCGSTCDASNGCACSGKCLDVPQQ
jgi:hypothetical protein